jgi:hypothetical protein
MPLLRPRNWFDDLCAGEFLYEVIVAVGAAVVTAMSARAYFTKSPPDDVAGYAVTAAGAVVCLTLLARARSRNKKALNQNDPHSLDAFLFALHAILRGWSKKSANASLRICVFVPIDGKEEVHQITDYVGAEGDVRKGRGNEFPTSHGIVGKAMRNKTKYFDSLPSDTDLVTYLCETYNFTQAEALEKQQDRRSWAAVPVGQNPVRAVIFLDCNQRDFFGPNQQKILDNAIVGVAQYLRPT